MSFGPKLGDGVGDGVGVGPGGLVGLGEAPGPVAQAAIMVAIANAIAKGVFGMAD
jgi:hypothetical protein